MPLQQRPPVGPKPETKKWRKTPRFLKAFGGSCWVSNKFYMTYISHRNPWDSVGRLSGIFTYMNGFWLCFMAVDVGNYTIHGASGLYTRLKVVT